MVLKTEVLYWRTLQGGGGEKPQDQPRAGGENKSQAPLAYILPGLCFLVGGHHS
jgi:hypothetical protein